MTSNGEASSREAATSTVVLGAVRPGKDGAMEWIATASKKPKKGQTILAFWTPKTGPVHPGCFATATYYPGHWHNPEDDEDDYAEPTHWMPLPAELVWNAAAKEVIETCAALAWEWRGCFCSDAVCRDFIERLRSNKELTGA